MEKVHLVFRAVAVIGKLFNNLCDCHGNFLVDKIGLTFIGSEIYVA